jgi:hypothetical protein
VRKVETPDVSQRSVLVIDEESFSRLRVPLPFPERVVLITRKDPETLSTAWDAGIVSVVSADDPPSTILLAIMAAALRVPKAPPAGILSGISPNHSTSVAPLSPDGPPTSAKTSKTR